MAVLSGRDGVGAAEVLVVLSGAEFLVVEVLAGGEVLVVLRR